MCYSCNSVLSVREAVGIREQREKAMDELRSQVQGLEKENKETRSIMFGMMMALKAHSKKIGSIEELDEFTDNLVDVLREYGLAQ